ncbi:MAG: 1-acyl-sn-glycerol-3-phosphate acyltransferase [Bacteroidales bacterium]|jgi:putative hemolysin|nr:1-acyl-sn-glycerol-3-phosphate acyltransferase [Bacteroidales bacterium]
MQNQETYRIDIGQLMAERFPDRKLPGFVLNLLKKIVHQDDINSLFANAPGRKNLDFIDSCMEQLRFTCRVAGEEHLPSDGRRLVFACNHPQGGAEAICIAHVLGRRYDCKIKFYANEFLTVFIPLKELFLPVHRRRQQDRESLRQIRDFYETDYHLVVFPAGVTAYKSKGKITEHEWHKHFIKVAVEHERDVVPLYFEASNSELFYRIENFRKRIHSKINFEVMLFAREFFRQRGRTFTLHIGKPVPWQTFDHTKNYQEWAHWMQRLVSGLPDRDKGDSA